MFSSIHLPINSAEEKYTHRMILLPPCLNKGILCSGKYAVVFLNNGGKIVCYLLQNSCPYAAVGSHKVS